MTPARRVEREAARALNMRSSECVGTTQSLTSPTMSADEVHLDRIEARAP